MDNRLVKIHSRHLLPALLCVAGTTLLATAAHAQGPQFDVGSPPGAAGGGSWSVNRSVRPLSRTLEHRRTHRSVAARAAWEATSRRAPYRHPECRLSSPGCTNHDYPETPRPPPVPQYGDLDLPADFVDYGTPGNMDLDAAIEQLVSQNLDLLAAKLEVPMAEADVLTANLRQPDLLRGHPASSRTAISRS